MRAVKCVSPHVGLFNVGGLHVELFIVGKYHGKAVHCLRVSCGTVQCWSVPCWDCSTH